MQPSSSPPFRMPMMTDIALPNEGPLSFSLIIENVPERWKKNVFPITLQNVTMEKMSIRSISTDGTTFRTVKKNATWLLVFEVKNVGFCITWSMAASCYIFYQVAAAHSKKKEAHHHLRRLPFSQDHVFSFYSLPSFHKFTLRPPLLYYGMLDGLGPCIYHILWTLRINGPFFTTITFFLSHYRLNCTPSTMGQLWDQKCRRRTREISVIALTTSYETSRKDIM